MRISLRRAVESDAAPCARVCYEAFSAIATEHRFPVDWHSEAVALQVIQSRLAHSQTHGVVALADNEIVGSAFLKEYRPIGAIGPVTVSPRVQGMQVGRMMMEHLIDRSDALGLSGTRLVQAAYNTHSLALYTKLGFQVRSLLACLHGPAIARRIPGFEVIAGAEIHIDACNRLCASLHGYARADDLTEAFRLRSLAVVQRAGKVRGYSTGIHFRGHTVAETGDDAKALISAASDLHEPGLLMPAADSILLRWALDNGLRITQPLTLMSRGFYQAPAGAFLPSIHA